MRLRDLPSVDELARQSEDPLAVEAARKVVARARELIQAGGDPGDLKVQLQAELHAARSPHLRRVINATGVIVHTNLGRAPLAEAALDRVREIARGCFDLLLFFQRQGKKVPRYGVRARNQVLWKAMIAHVEEANGLCRIQQLARNVSRAVDRAFMQWRHVDDGNCVFRNGFRVGVTHFRASFAESA